MKKSFTLLEVLITTVLLTAGVISLSRAFGIGLAAYMDTENVSLALNIAQTKLEEIKNTPFESLADSGPVPDFVFPSFDITVDVAEGQNPMRVDVDVSWENKGGQSNVTLTTVIADY